MDQPTPREPASREPADRQKVVYVMGSGHSGSTILGVTLGNCEGFFFAGELDNWLMRAGVSVLGGLERTRFWSDVRGRVPGAEELFGTDALRLLERSSAALRPERRGRAAALRERWRPVTAALYRAIGDVSGAEYVVDTSHFPLRARELQQLGGIELYLILLVRDPDEVMHSFTRMRQGDSAGEQLGRVVSKNLDIWLTHVLALSVFRRQPAERRLALRHEDFIADPPRALQRIFALTGSGAALPDLGALRTGFPIQGNRLIRSETVALESRAPKPRAWTTTRVMQTPWEWIFARLRPRLEG